MWLLLAAMKKSGARGSIVHRTVIRNASVSVVVCVCVRACKETKNHKTVKRWPYVETTVACWWETVVVYRTEILQSLGWSSWRINSLVRPLNRRTVNSAQESDEKYRLWVFDYFYLSVAQKLRRIRGSQELKLIIWWVVYLLWVGSGGDRVTTVSCDLKVLECTPNLTILFLQPPQKGVLQFHMTRFNSAWTIIFGSQSFGDGYFFHTKFEWKLREFSN